MAESVMITWNGEREIALPSLHGVPIAIKDLNMTEGVPTKLGSRAFEDFVPPFSDFVVDKLRAAGGDRAVDAAGLAGKQFTGAILPRDVALHETEHLRQFAAGADIGSNKQLQRRALRRLRNLLDDER